MPKRFLRSNHGVEKMRELRRIRIESGLTLAVVGRHMGVGRARVCQIERAERVRPSLERRYRAAVREASSERRRVERAVRRALGRKRV